MSGYMSGASSEETRREEARKVVEAIDGQKNPETDEAFFERCDMVTDAANRGITLTDLVDAAHAVENDRRKTAITDE